MNRNSIKRFANDARRELLQKIENKAKQIEITDAAIIEETAYKWFIRIIALRFMEMNGLLPEKVFDNINNSSKHTLKKTIFRNCDELHPYFPSLFSKDETYLKSLFPEELLNEQSFITKLTDPLIIPDELMSRVEIIGWLYQYFFAEEKEHVIKAKKKYTTAEIPYATQVFTPDWIVRYMVQNTLGRYWIESHPEHRDLIANWEFYIENQDDEVRFEQNLEPYIDQKIRIEEIKCFDPAMGSGHILVYMFDVLYEIYCRCGYNKQEIPRLIIEYNLYGVDIDDRVYDVAVFLLTMKAMQYDKNFLTTAVQDGLKMNLVSMQETNHVTHEDIACFVSQNNERAFVRIEHFINQFINAKTFGSLLQIDSVDYDFLKQNYEGLRQSKIKLAKLMPALLKQAQIFQNKYDVLVTNPPYIGNRYLNSDLSNYIETFYPLGKKDLFAAFMLAGFKKVKKYGLLGFMTPYVWMFISSFEGLRSHIMYEKDISTLIQLEYSGFDGATVPVCTFTLRNYKAGIPGQYINLAEFKGVNNQPLKTLKAVKNPKVDYRYSVNADIFKKIQGHPLSFWAGKQAIHVIENAEKLETIAKARVGLQTSDNQRFLRLWHEVDFQKIGFGMKDRSEARESKLKWFPYNKGGEYRKWYGNQFYVVNWEDDGREIREFNTYLNASRDSKIGIANTEFYFKESITWSFVSSSYFGVRYSEKGFLFDTGGSSAFVDGEFIYYITAFLCSKLAYEFLRIQNPTLNFQPGNIANLPLVIPENQWEISEIIDLAKENIKISKSEWDSYETSWNFKVHPLLKFKGVEKTVGKAFENWKRHSQKMFSILKSNEEKLNGLFIDIYDLGNEYTPEVNDENVTIRQANLGREIKSFISYAIGCMFGRYSLDEDGLIFAGGEFNEKHYKTFTPTKDNIVPILSDGHSGNDIFTRFVEFVKIIFGDETLTENLKFIASAIGVKKGENPRSALHRYFLQDFYKDHLKVYKKRPIYWLFTSGKHRAFNCLVYIHRYDTDTLTRIRDDYLREQLGLLEEEKSSLLKMMDSGSDGKEIAKELKALEMQIEELKKYYYCLHEQAEQQIEIDLDDGVAVNYQKFEGLVAPIK
ncbi:BREX-1 system adenine-specific DNA-methyltransferase PglX [Schinkia azotoformans]|uniref:BREX-1 system adenine-specific DNA-methyltransferase PglX n=1 Tax=Schinkia azotoformans TaxID=1454 RepID=UPI002DB7B8D7|nr:BREX-1 system adenine-specific DNA-methyltransferase PglX [Schinkia azotoformans]MEC1714241.1 BREX-1 system adenine-specific DNA-methyltransferase PglX [Schinkia azotoformans]